jgi:hypothetical protein
MYVAHRLGAEESGPPFIFCQECAYLPGGREEVQPYCRKCGHEAELIGAFKQGPVVALVRLCVPCATGEGAVLEQRLADAGAAW